MSQPYELTASDEQLINLMERGEKIESFPADSRKYIELVTGILFQFADSEMSGAAGYTRFINLGPTIDDRRTLATIAAEKMSMVQSTYKLLRELGLNMDKYFSSHCWEARIQRKATLGFRRAASDRRLNALMYPLESWADVAVFTYLMASMACLQLEEFAGSSFLPWSDLVGQFLTLEKTHAKFGQSQMEKIVNQEGDSQAIQLSLDYWFERVLTSFGPAQSMNNELYRRFKLKSKQNETLAKDWQNEVVATCHLLGLQIAAVGVRDATTCH